MTLPRALFVLTLLLGPFLTAGPGSGAPRQGPDPEAVNEAIERGVRFLLATQEADGSWGGANLLEYPEGATALCVAALLHSGVDPGHPAIQKGIAFVRSRPLVRYYGVVTRMLMEDILGPEKDLEAMKQCAEFIVSGAGSGYFDYPGLNRPDLSNTQYCILGLWLAHKNGIKVPEKVFEEALQTLLREQLSDGGWAYFAKSAGAMPGAMPTGPTEWHATCSMTTAGMSSLLFCMDALSKNKKYERKYREDVDAALERGYAWLDEHMAYDRNASTKEPDENAEQWDYYYIYTIERLGFISGRDELGGKPWYPTGAEFLVKAQQPNGSWGGRRPNWFTDTPFALLFLVRATQARTGEGMRRKPKAIMAPDPSAYPVDFRILPGERTVAWIAGFSDQVRERYGKRGEFGLRVESVRYFVDGEEVAVLEGDVERFSGNERFEVELPLTAGEHTVQAVVRIAPEPERGEPLSDRRVNLDGPRLVIHVDWVLTPEDLAVLEELPANLVPGSNPEVEVSSEQEGLLAGVMATDGSLAHGWVTALGDREPWIRLSWRKGLKSDTLVLSPPPGNRYRKPTRVQLIVNGKAREIELQGKPREHVDLQKRIAVKTLELRILDSEPMSDASGDETGFAEIELLGKVKKRKRR